MPEEERQLEGPTAAINTLACKWHASLLLKTHWPEWVTWPLPTTVGTRCPIQPCSQNGEIWGGLVNSTIDDTHSFAFSFCFVLYFENKVLRTLPGSSVFAIIIFTYIISYIIMYVKYIFTYRVFFFSGCLLNERMEFQPCFLFPWCCRRIKRTGKL